jgi:DNA replication and repair protein RecF
VSLVWLVFGMTARLVTLAVREFRNIATADLAVPAAGVVLVGDNGHGKTNLLEAVAYLAILRSVRDARDRDLVRHGAVAWHLRATLAGTAIGEIGLGAERSTGRKRITLDGVVTTKQGDALGALPSVMWSPADVALVAGGPGERRHYLDVLLALSSRSYLTALRGYRAALTRRNAALREAQRAGRHAGAAHVWEPALADHGAQLVAHRRAWVAEHAAGFTALCTAIGESAVVSLAYAGDVDAVGDVTTLASVLRAALERGRTRDLARGVTGSGPHRDDLTIALDGRDVRTFGSAGQQRSAAIALRLLAARTLRAALGTPPVLLLDDPFAELDATRSERTLALLESEVPGQILLAVPRAADIPAHFTKFARWGVRDGVITP